MVLELWFLFFIFIQFVHFLGTWKLYVAAGRKAWEAAVPVYNVVVLLKIIRRPSWWTVLLFIPIVNVIMVAVIWVELLRSFGKSTLWDAFLVIFSGGLYLFYLNYLGTRKFLSDRNGIARVKSADTVGSLLFAVIVATIVHTYLVQPFTIPTPSLEKSLLVGDFLFVSKVNYGARVPLTALALPMVHDSIPVFKQKSYFSWPQIPYFRFPAFEKIDRSDIVVFNWPVDTVRKFREAKGNAGVIKPIDKKSNYVKRCLGIPGDHLSIKDGIVYVNGNILELPERAKPQYSYQVGLDGKTPVDFESIFKELDITDPVLLKNARSQDTLLFTALTAASAERLKNTPGITGVKREIAKEVEEAVFPYNNKWNKDNLGPIYIPEQGKTVAINVENLPFYERIISTYEKDENGKDNELKVVGKQIVLNGKSIKSYTFKQNYYWMMGDNRHNSEDSRYWGFVPADHIVGKPVFIWMSWDTNGAGWNKIRWERLFTTVNGEGQPQSYLKYFLILLTFYFVGEYFWKKRKKQ